VIGGEAFEMYSRDILECIQALWSNPDFASVLAVEPERQYADKDQTIRVIHDMQTGKWWWSTQVSGSIGNPFN
jgi:Plavaka transposase